MATPGVRGPTRKAPTMSRLIVLYFVALLVIGGCSNTGTVSPVPSAGSSDNGAAATETPVPTATTETPTASPATFKPISLKGRGSMVPKFSIPDGASAIATISEKGSGNFAVTSLAADGSQNDLLVNVIGNYAGTVLFDAQSGEHSVALKVESGGTWTIAIKPVTAARVWNGTSKLAGQGDDVVVVAPASSGLVTLDITHSGTANFAVTGYSENSGSDVMVNEIGKYSGQVLLAKGSFLITVEADGAWTIAPGS